MEGVSLELAAQHPVACHATLSEFHLGQTLARSRDTDSGSFWLSINNRCWTADHLAREGLPHPAACPLCDQMDESIQLMLITCVFAHQVWCIILQRLGSTVCKEILKLVVSSNKRISQGDKKWAQLSHYSSVLGDLETSK